MLVLDMKYILVHNIVYVCVQYNIFWRNKKYIFWYSIEIFLY